MSDNATRFFKSDCEIRRLGEGLLACSLSKDEWTHEAHLAACLWLLVERPDIQPERKLPDIIRRFNVAAGGVNDETQGYHETITQCYIVGVRQFLALGRPDCPLVDRVNALLAAPQGSREWPLTFFSKERLMSKQARLNWVEPDICKLPD